MADSITIGKQHRHTTVPVRATGRMIQVRCTGCSKTFRRASTPCPKCADGALQRQTARVTFAQHYLEVKADSGVETADALEKPPMWDWQPGCDTEGCVEGRILRQPSLCCCRQDVTKCSGCRNAPDPFQPHVCLRKSPEELDAELFAEDLVVETHVPEPATKRRAQAMDQSQGPRAPKH